MYTPLKKTQLPNLLVDAGNFYRIVPNGFLSEFDQCQTTGDAKQTVNWDGYSLAFGAADERYSLYLINTTICGSRYEDTPIDRRANSRRCEVGRAMER
ncbi:MAG: hypothetical protein IPJ27_20800 [Candidatus Accumulibacter sp.]|uniref:Uncharacterized protein n=1 Tax=Candidatus Accumulibacter proximus TaxID=2954385 RepID=A0A935Q3R3_9PROT|nr:hypothetical protein [Candidatus Accumulibacter proximus]